MVPSVSKRGHAAMQRSKLLLLGLLVVVLVIVGYLAWQRWRPLRAEDKLELIREKNVALGNLENGGQFDPALRSFDKIVAALPREPLGFRNRVIALFKPNDDAGDTTVSLTGIEPAVAALEP